MRKLHSLTGTLPVGGFLVFHLWTNSKALQGQERFDAAVAEISHMPYLPVLEIGLVLLPLLFHAAYGVKLSLEARPNVGSYPTSRNWMYTMQRVTGIVAFLFIGFHLYEYWLPKWLGTMAPEDFFPALCANMSSTVGGFPVTAVVYIIGITASVLHFTNGLWGFCFSWGITVSRRSQRMAATVFGLAAIALLVLGINTVIYFASGSQVSIFGTASGAELEHRVKTCERPGGMLPAGPAAPAAPAAAPALAPTAPPPAAPPPAAPPPTP